MTDESLDLVDLLTELTTKSTALKPVELHDRPAYIGGKKPLFFDRLRQGETGFPNDINAVGSTLLQREFIRESIKMQERVRPKVREFQMLRQESLNESGLYRVMRELQRHANVKANSEVIQDKVLDCRSSRLETMTRMKFQIDQIISQRNGWSELMREVREPTLKLEPIELYGFYIVRRYA